MRESRYLGRPVRRLEDERFLRGRAIFTDDIDLPGALYLALVRSPYPHAEIATVDWSQATRVPGFVTALSGRDLVDWLSPFPVPPQSAGVRPQRRYPLAVDRVRFVGEGVVAVLATDRSAAEKAAAEVLVEFRELPAGVDPKAALAPDAPRLHPDWPGNEACRGGLTVGAVDAASRSAGAISELEFVNQRVYAAFPELRAAAVTIDPAHRHLTGWASTPTNNRGVVTSPASSVSPNIRSAS